MNTVIIGIGNSFRRDDGVGPAVAGRLAERDLRDVRVTTTSGDCSRLLDAWSGAELAVLVDAAGGDGATPGRIRRWTADDLDAAPIVSSHAIGLAQSCGLARALRQMPDDLVVFTIDAADTRPGVGLTPAVASAVPVLTETITAEVRDRRGCG